MDILSPGSMSLSTKHYFKELEVRRQRTEHIWFKALNIEPQNKEPQNDEVISSIFGG